MDPFIPYMPNILDLFQDGAKVSEFINLYLGLKMPNRMHSQNPESLKLLGCLPLTLTNPKFNPL